MKHRQISPAVLPLLKEALAKAFWYKRDLRRFVASCLKDQSIVPRIDWAGQYKWYSVEHLVDLLHRESHRHFEDLLNLLLSTADLDPRHLLRVDDGKRKYDEARASIAVLRERVEPMRAWREEVEEAARRRETEKERSLARQAMSGQLSQLRAAFQDLLTISPQQRGFALEKLLARLFDVFDIEAKGSFRIVGEQIDGAFTLEGTEFLLEAKWEKKPARRSDLDVFAQKVVRKLDNTLGLFVSINGYEASAVEAHSGARPSVLLADGADLMAVLEERIDLPELLRRKRQHAARTGEVLVPVERILG